MRYVYRASFALALAAAALSASCSPFAGSLPADEATRCTVTQLETDFSPSEWLGPRVTNGALPEGSYVISSTYLRIQANLGAQSRFGDRMSAIRALFASQPGFVGLQFSLSPSCITARTLSVWESEEAMMNFVTSAPHLQAMRETSMISRGGSLTTHFRGTHLDATWQRAAAELGASGPSRY